MKKTKIMMTRLDKIIQNTQMVDCTQLETGDLKWLIKRAEAFDLAMLHIETAKELSQCLTTREMSQAILNKIQKLVEEK